MRFRHTVSAGSILALLALAGCSGGSSPSGGTMVTPTPDPIATLPVILSAASADVNVDEGRTAAFAFTANYTGSSTRPIVADVKVGGTRYALDGTPTASGTSFNVALKTAAFAPGGKASSTVTFRLCTAADCATVYPGSTATFTVNLDVRLKDWGTFQRDAAHTGYVAVKYKTADFADAWNLPVAGPYAPSAIAARRGNVFVNLRTVEGAAAVLRTRSLNASTGATAWEYELGNKGYSSAPSYANGRVVSAAMAVSSGVLPLDVIDADRGTYLRSLIYPSQFAVAGTPTPFGDNLYHAAGYFGNEVFGYDAAAGTAQWTANGFPPGIGIVQEGESVAVDADFVYFFDAGYLLAISRSTGAVVHSIRNPYFSQPGVSYFGSYFGGPILDGAGRVFTFSDNRARVSPLPLIAFSTASDSVLWRTSRRYVGDPALRDGKLYAVRPDSAIIDIIDTADGSVTGTIDLGADKGILTSNVVLTGSHLFVASDSATYAVDLQQASFPTVWTAPHGGPLAITPDNLLTVSAAAGVYAYKLS